MSDPELPDSDFDLVEDVLVADPDYTCILGADGKRVKRATVVTDRIECLELWEYFDQDGNRYGVMKVDGTIKHIWPYVDKQGSTFEN